MQQDASPKTSLIGDVPEEFSRSQSPISSGRVSMMNELNTPNCPRCLHRWKQ